MGRAICLDRNTIKTKKVNGTLNLKVFMGNSDKPIVCCPETQNNLRVNKTTSRKKLTVEIHVHKFKKIGDKTQKMLY